MTKTKFTGEPGKEARRALRTKAYAHLKSRKIDLQAKNTDVGIELSYISPGTFIGQAEGYLRYLLCTGGPREELRFYSTNRYRRAYKIVYSYIEYTHGVQFDLTNEEWAQDLFGCFVDSGILEEQKLKSI